ncbi:MAG TPA: UbiA-like polyprenyltransferase [Syntrophomonadaceae bacterium]|nr:UbiA-like polyprenyltransferase [Syntrophomonadaceae bacterium]
MNKLTKFLTMIDFSNSLFGLPFAYMGAVLALKSIPAGIRILWITIAMVAARTAAMCLNRLIDRNIDRANPRTSYWIMASGQLPLIPVWVMVIVCFALLFYSASQLNPLCVKLAPLAVIILWGYSYTKRFTWWCHLILGLAIGIGPVGAWIAVTGTFDWQPLMIGMAVACWIAGFDTMYACQDIEFDRQNQLFSIPARFGEIGALKFSAGFHLFTIIFLILNGIDLDLGFWYFCGVLIAASILIYEHMIVKPGDLSRVNFASFKINQYVGLIILGLTLIDIV